MVKNRDGGIRKIIKKRIEVQRTLKKMNKRNKLRTTGTPPLPIDPSLTRDEIRRGVNKTKVNIERFNTPYKKKVFVDYDAVVIISSYNRFEKLYRILKQLHEQETKYKIKIIIYNDGSSDCSYEKILENYPNIDYISCEINNGKYKYWETITTLLKKASQYISHVLIQIDDDFILCDDFINELIDKFFEGKEINNKNVAIHYHITGSGERCKWGIDGGTLFDSNFLVKINYNIDAISENRWKYNSEISSGVWKQVSEKMRRYGLLTYMLENSLAKHDGNEDSKMNTSERNRSPIITHKLKKELYNVVIDEPNDEK